MTSFIPIWRVFNYRWYLFWPWFTTFVLSVHNQLLFQYCNHSMHLSLPLLIQYTFGNSVFLSSSLCILSIHVVDNTCRSYDKIDDVLTNVVVWSPTFLWRVVSIIHTIIPYLVHLIYHSWRIIRPMSSHSKSYLSFVTV